MEPGATPGCRCSRRTGRGPPRPGRRPGSPAARGASRRAGRRPRRQRRVHRQVGQHLEQVVLHHVADRPDGVVERAAVGDVEVLGHGDLEVVESSCRFHSGSSRVLANRSTSRSSTGSLPRKWSTRNTRSSGKCRRSRASSSQAEARSRPNGFSTTSRERSARPAAAMPVGDRAEQRRRYGEVVHREGVRAGLGGDGVGEVREDRRVGVVARDEVDAASVLSSTPASTPRGRTPGAHSPRRGYAARRCRGR